MPSRRALSWVPCLPRKARVSPRRDRLLVAKAKRVYDESLLSAESSSLARSWTAGSSAVREESWLFA
jgi:hypothetical protein